MTQQATIEKMQPQVKDLHEQLRKLIYQGAKDAGWAGDYAEVAVRSAEVPFFAMIGKGEPPQIALLTAVFFADLMAAQKLLHEEMEKGATPEKAFEVVKATKMKATDDKEQSKAMADIATKAFKKALKDGKPPHDALAAAFEAARDS